MIWRHFEQRLYHAWVSLKSISKGQQRVSKKIIILFKMNVMKEIFQIRSCIEILANDIKIMKKCYRKELAMHKPCAKRDWMQTDMWVIYHDNLTYPWRSDLARYRHSQRLASFKVGQNQCNNLQCFAKSHVISQYTYHMTIYQTYNRLN